MSVTSVNIDGLEHLQGCVTNRRVSVLSGDHGWFLQCFLEWYGWYPKPMSTTIEANKLAAYNDSIRQTTPQIVRDLRGRLGARLVAYIANVTETRAVKAWAEGERTPAPNTDRRLRTAFQVATLIDLSEGEGVAATWFQGMNPQLGDRSPARVLHEDNSDDALTRVLGAARGFVGA